MFLFYQLSGGEETWKYVEDSKENRDAIARKNAAFVAALAISAVPQKPDEVLDYEKIKYRGDLYFDIDSPDLTESISVANNLIVKLRKLEVEDFSIFLSGKKGLHITVPSKVFSKGGQVKFLPYVYGKIAEKLDIAGLDFAVYSGGRGRLWRQENVCRPATKTYKVEISADALITLTKEKYAVLVSSPAAPVVKREPKKSLPLSELYEYCKIAVDEEEKLKSKFVYEVVPELKALKDVPGCITKLVSNKTVKQGSNFNKAAMQLAGFVKSSGLEKATIDTLVEAMSTNVDSGTYNTKAKKEQHIRSHLRRAAYDPRMGFAPSYLFSSVEPCGDCILCNGELDKYYKDSRTADEMEIDGCPLFESGGKYWVRMGKIDRPVSSFTMTPIMYSEIYDPITTVPERESTTVEIVYEHLGQIKRHARGLDERCWDSVSAFKKSISGIDNIIFRGGEADLQDLKHYIFSQDVQMGKITKVKSCGVMQHKLNSTGKSILVYTEPGFSINLFGEEGTHEVHKTIHSPPRAFENSDLDYQNPTHVRLAKDICNINDKFNMAQILGWFVACHFKPHIMACEKQFPLLGLWGNAGSGKSKTAAIMSYLHGCDYEGADAIVTCGGSTPWSLGTYIATSTSTPRLLDEFNQSKLGPLYSKVVDLLKACFNEQSITKGVIAGRNSAAEISETKLTGPVCVMSEQFPGHEAALIQRLVAVQLSRKSRAGCLPAWDFVYNHRQGLGSIAKALVLTSLKTPKKTLRYWMDHYRTLLPSEHLIDSRPHFSLRVVLTGLKMYELTMEAYGIDVSQEVGALEESLLGKLESHIESISQANNRSIVDKTLDVMAQMAADAAKNTTIRTGMVNGSAYLRDDESLYVDVEGIYGQYKIYTRSLGEAAVIQTYREFLTLVSEEPYFLGESACEVLTSRKVLLFDVEGLRKKGVSVNLFEKME